MSLNDRNGTVLTMKNESAITTATISSREAWTEPVTAKFATMIATSRPAAPGMGRPTMYLLGFLGAPLGVVASTLKRASRIAPHARYTNEHTIPPKPSSWRDQR